MSFLRINLQNIRFTAYQSINHLFVITESHKHKVTLQHTRRIGIMITTNHRLWVCIQTKTHFIHHTWTLYKSIC